MMFIILTPADADIVRGPGLLPDTMLMPREIGSGEFILPLAVLDDPAHATHRDFLAGLPQRDVDAGLLQQGESTE